MTRTACSTLAALAAIVTMATGPAWADEPASLIIHKAVLKPWTLAIPNGKTQIGKLKIFTQEPRFDSKMNLVPGQEFTELRADGTISGKGNDGKALNRSSDGRKCTLPRSGSNYWVIFYPHRTVINLDLQCYPAGQEAHPVVVTITKSVIPKPAGLMNLAWKALGCAAKFMGVPLPQDFGGSYTLDMGVEPASTAPKFDLRMENFEKFGTVTGLKTASENAFLVLN